MTDYFNPFLAYEQCKQVYKSFIDSYHKFTNSEINSQFVPQCGMNWMKLSTI